MAGRDPKTRSPEAPRLRAAHMTPVSAEDNYAVLLSMGQKFTRDDARGHVTE